MNPVSMEPIASENKVWKDMLGLSNRSVPELYEFEEQVQNTPHAFGIRKIMREFAIRGVFCIQDKPEIVIFRQTDDNVTEVQRVYNALWNQGLASILVVVGPDIIRIFSLLKRLADDEDSEDLDSLIINSIEIASSQKLEGFAYAVESGRYWQENVSHFNPEMRIDKVILENLVYSHDKLQRTEGLDSEEAQSSLIQTMFIAYLEDRNILSKEFFQKCTNGRCRNLNELLQSQNVKICEDFFARLKKKFNGDLFVAPCSFDDSNPKGKLTPGAMEILRKFRQGKEEMQSGLLRLYNYDFKYIPVTLVSEVYNRFLSLDLKSQRRTGSFFTPLPVVDSTLDSLWPNLESHQMDGGQFLDPACGSGLFLVRCFQKLCEHQILKQGGGELSWLDLVRTVKQVHGFDVDSKAVRLAIFSLYVAMMEFIPKSKIADFLEGGHRLPKLWNKTLINQDYFNEINSQGRFDVIFGNPPWKSESSENSGIKWAEANKKTIPYQELSWSFVIKAQEDLKEAGIVAFVLPVGRFLHSQTDISLVERNALFKRFKILRVINFSDFRRQLFNSTEHAAATIVLKARNGDSHDYKFEYMVPKSDLNFSINHSIVVRRIDRMKLRLSDILKNPAIFTQKFWISSQEFKLLSYLDSMPKLEAIVSRRTGKNEESDRWTIGRGFQAYQQVSGIRRNPKHEECPIIAKVKHLDEEKFLPFWVDTTILQTWPTSSVAYKGFVEAYSCPKILLQRAFSLSNSRLVAANVAEPLSFSDKIFAISYPDQEADRAKFITAILNSKLAIWWSFHNASSVGTHIPRLNQNEILKIPMPEPDSFVTDKLKNNAKKVQKNIVNQVNKFEKIICYKNNNIYNSNYSYLLKDELKLIDNLVFEYFDLSADEIQLIEDTVDYKLNSVNSKSRIQSIPKLWQPPSKTERESYAQKLDECLSRWLIDGKAISIILQGYNDDYGMIKLQFCNQNSKKDYREESNTKFVKQLEMIADKSDGRIKNFQLIPDFRIFDDNCIFLIKPMQFRYWMRSSAIEDTMSIAMDAQKLLLDRRNKEKPN